jgi:hypothetical protein
VRAPEPGVSLAVGLEPDFMGATVAGTSIGAPLRRATGSYGCPG